MDDNSLPNSQANIEQSGFSPGYNDSAAMQIRLDTDGVKIKVYLYLKGIYESIEVDDKGNLSKQLKKLGKAKVNEKGIQSVMMFVEQTMNAQTVQGNRSDIDFGSYMYNFRMSLARDMWINQEVYGIDEVEYDGIIDSICLMIEPFMSRTINNEERKSYGQSWVQRDSNTVQGGQKKKFMDYLSFLGGSQ